MLQGTFAGPAAGAAGNLGTKAAFLTQKGFIAAQSAARQATAQFPQRSSSSRLALQATTPEVDARNYTPNGRRPQAAPEHLQVGATHHNLACATHAHGPLLVLVHVYEWFWQAGGGPLWWGSIGGALKASVAAALAPLGPGSRRLASSGASSCPSGSAGRPPHRSSATARWRPRPPRSFWRLPANPRPSPPLFPPLRRCCKPSPRAAAPCQRCCTAC